MRTFMLLILIPLELQSPFRLKMRTKERQPKESDKGIDLKESEEQNKLTNKIWFLLKFFHA